MRGKGCVMADCTETVRGSSTGPGALRRMDSLPRLLRWLICRFPSLCLCTGHPVEVLASQVRSTAVRTGRLRDIGMSTRQQIIEVSTDSLQLVVFGAFGRAFFPSVPLLQKSLVGGGCRSLLKHDSKATTQKRSDKKETLRK